MDPVATNSPRQCRSCGAENPPESTYCAYCGSLLPAGPEEQTEPERDGTPPDRAVPIGDRFGASRASFKRIGLIWFILLSIITLGIYPACWVILRRKDFNALNGTEKIADWAAFLPLGLVLLFLFLGTTLTEGQGGEVFNLLSFAVWIWLAFKMRRILRDHVAAVAPDYAENNVAPSALWTVIFTLFYIQHQINRLIDVDILRRRN